MDWKEKATVIVFLIFTVIMTWLVITQEKNKNKPIQYIEEIDLNGWKS